LFTPEYVEIVDIATFKILKYKVEVEAAICVSAHLGNARLIDNLLVSV